MVEILRVPLLNANEDELTVMGVHASEGAHVQAGQLLFQLESTKALSDVEAPRAGYVRQLGVAEGDRVAVGHVLCVLTATADEPVVLPGAGEPRIAGEGLRATRKARELADAHGIDLAVLGIDGLVKERDVEAWLGSHRSTAPSTPSPRGWPELLSGPNPTLLFGAGGHARVLVDLVREGHRDLTLVGAVDDGEAPPVDVLGVPVVGGSTRLAELRERGVELALLGVGAVTGNALRVALYERLLAAGFRVPNLIHPRASIEPSASMGRGNQIFAGAVVGSAARLGDNVIVNSGVVVSHDCVIGSHAHLTPGAILAGGVSVGENAVIGMGVTIYLGVTVGRDAVIANGAHVLKDVPPGAFVRGAPT